MNFVDLVPWSRAPVKPKTAKVIKVWEKAANGKNIDLGYTFLIANSLE